MKFETVPKFRQLAEFLEKQIRGGSFPQRTKIPSERDLAKKYSLSHMTVNKALSTLVEKKLLERVYGDGTYVADLKENLISYRTVGLVIETEERLHDPFARYLPSQLQSKGYFATLMDIRNDIKPHLERFLREESFGLMIDAYSTFPFETLKKLKKSTRLVFINRFEGPRRYKEASYALADYVKGGYLAAKHLLKGGRKNILILSFEIKPGWTSDLFYRGCQKARKEYGGNFTYLVTEETPAKTYYEIFKSRKRPEGIISFADARVIPVLKVLRDLKLKIPEDVAIIGYHNTPWAEAYNLTSLSIREKLIAEKGIEMLKEGRNEEIYVEPEIIFRGSCPGVNLSQMGGEKGKEVHDSVYVID